MVNGVLVIDKPSGMTSFQVVKRVRKITRQKKAGHTGTLDPIATGVLPICLGKATKIVQFIMAGHKKYQGTMILGVTTDTYDADGNIVKESPVPGNLDLVTLRSVAGRYTGDILQTPPAFSAVKHQGQPLYKLARKGIVVKKDARPIKIFSFEILKVDLPYVDFTVHCSKGTYVRSLVHEMGEYLGCGAHLHALRRTVNGPFNEDQAVTLDELEDRVKANRLMDIIVSIGDALTHIPALMIDRDLAAELRAGYKIPPSRIEELVRSQGVRLAPGIPFLRLMIRGKGMSSPDSGQKTELVSIIAWPGGEGSSDLESSVSNVRPMKIWQSENAIAL